MNQPLLPLPLAATATRPDLRPEKAPILPAALWSNLTTAQQQLLARTLTDICRQLVADSLAARPQEVSDELN